MVQTSTIRNEAVLIELLPGLSKRIDIGNILSGHVERHLTGDQT